MAVIDDILAGQQAEQNQGLALAAHDASWANFFNSTPSVEKLRANLNLTNMVDEAVRRKQDMLAQTDLKAAQLREANARHDEFIKQAPLREDLLRARVDATGAAERRRAMEATIRENDTKALNEDVHAAYKAGVKPGTPAFQDAVFSSIAKNSHADPAHIREVHKLAGGADEVVDPVAFAAEGVAMKEAARTAGLKNPRLRNANGKWVVDESADVVTDEQKISNAVARYKALEDAKAPAAAIASLEKERSLHAQALSRAKRIRAKATDTNVIADADEDISQSEKALADVESQIRTHRETKAGASGKEPPTTPPTTTAAASPDGPRKVTSAQEFHDLPSGAEFIDPQGVKRRKP